MVCCASPSVATGSDLAIVWPEAVAISGELLSQASQRSQTRRMSSIVDRKEHDERMVLGNWGSCRAVLLRIHVSDHASYQGETGLE